MSSLAGTPEPPLRILEVQPNTPRFEEVLRLAARVLAQGRHLTSAFPAARESHVLGPEFRRRGVGTALQEHAMRECRAGGCYQMRSRSPVTSTENYALKLAMGYVVHPSSANDSYYFLIRL